MPRTKEILFVTRSTVGIGGMQTLQRGLRQFFDEHGVSYSLLSHRGSKLLLPFFFVRALRAGLFFRGQTIHCGDAALAPLGWILSRCRPDLRFTATVHGLDLLYPNFFYQWILRSSLPAFHTVVSISVATKAEALTRGALQERVIIIPPPISLPPATPRVPANALHILLLGRQIPRKGTRWFLQCVAPRLYKLYPDLRITVAGAGPELSSIREAVQSEKLEAVVSVLGSVSEDEKEKLYASSSHFLLPNISVPGDMEGFGLVCIEAASRGLQVVAAAREGIRDAVLEGETGFLFESQNADSCIEAIRLSLKAPIEPSVLTRNIEERFSLSVVGSLYLSHVFRAP